MATGTSWRPAGYLEGGPSSDNLASAAIPGPLPAELVAFGGFGFGAHGALTTPSSGAGARTGARAPVHDLAWFERIHVIPRRVDLGFLLSEQAFAVEVWNAFRSRSKALTAVNITGSSGLTVDNPDTLPAVYPATRSRIFTVHANASGDPTIDNRVVWVFTGVPTAGTDLVVVGSRLVPWSFPADGGDDVVESIEWLTDILKAWDDSEQRIQLREFPRRGLEYDVILTERDAQHANALIHNWQPRVFGVPFWQFTNPITAPVSIGAVSVQVDTSSIPWGELRTLFLWRDPYTWEAVTVASVTPTQINLATPAAKAWPIGTLAMPLGVGRMPAEQSFGWEALRVGRVRTAFTIEAAA